MKILLTLRQPLYPADTGGKVRSLNIFSRLAKRASIHAVSFADAVADAASIREMQRLFESYTPVFWQETKKYSPRFYKEIFTNQFSSLPYFLAKCRLPHFRSTIEGLLAKEHFDVLFSDFLHTAVPLLQCSFKPKIVFEHNVEFLLRKRKWQVEKHPLRKIVFGTEWRRTRPLEAREVEKHPLRKIVFGTEWRRTLPLEDREVEKHPLRKIVFGTEWRRTRPLEARVSRSFDHVLTVSEEDQQTIRHEFGINQVSTLPTGVDTDFFCPSGNGPQPGRLAFVGSMDWDPNEDGVVWFLENIYPLIRHTVPDASFVVVGTNHSSRLRAIAARTPAVEITGWVPDVRPYLSQAEVVVVPLRIGGGTRIKIPEAMAMGKAVVSTPIGAEGLHFQDTGELGIVDLPD